MNVKPLYDYRRDIGLVFFDGLELYNEQPIQKLIAELEKDPVDDPAFEKLITALENLIDHSFVDKTNVLQAIDTSRHYLLRMNQVAIEANEERLQQVPTFSINNINTTFSYLEFKPLIDALTQKEEDDYQQRLEIIQKARNTGLYQDMRMYSFLSQALEDENDRIADEVEEIIKNEIGEGIISFVLAHFECNGDEVNRRRFTLLAHYNYEGLDELIDEIFESNSQKLQLKAIEYMSENVAYEERILSFCDNPQKPIREVAYWGLANLKTENAERKLCEFYAKAIKKKGKSDLEIIAKALLQTGMAYTFNDVLALAKESFSNFLSANKKADAEMLAFLKQGVAMLQQIDKPEVYSFLFEILLNKEYNEIVAKKENVLSRLAKEISYIIIQIVQKQDKEGIMAFYDNIINEMPDNEWKLPFYKTYFAYCVREGHDIDVYDKFLPHFLSGHVGIEDLVALYNIEQTGIGVRNDQSILDKRWIDVLYDALQNIDKEKHVDVLLEALHALEPVPSEKFNQALILASGQTKMYLLEITSMIMKRDLPDKYEVVFSLIKQCHDRREPSSSNMLRQLPRASYWSEFPKEYADKFKELKNAPRAIFTKIKEG